MGKNPKMPPDMIICGWHKIIARSLTSNDSVVNFNYDSIMAFALLNEKKISPKSFSNPYLTLDIEDPNLSENPVSLVTPHGSFTWYAHLTSDGNFFQKNVTVGLKKFPPQKSILNKFLILPLKQKEIILNKFPIFIEEMKIFVEKLLTASEIYLIGKQFATADQDIADIIKKTCLRSMKKHIVYVNPDSKNKSWIDFHNDIFNANSYEKFYSLQSFIGTIS